MTNDKNLHQEWAQIEIEHTHLFTLFGKLENSLERAAALQALEELEKWLIHHFTREEQAGGVLRSLPGDDPTVQAVIAEHAAILEMLEETRAILEAAVGPALTAEHVGQVTHELGASLRSHEQHERQLIAAHLGAS